MLFTKFIYQSKLKTMYGLKQVIVLRLFRRKIHTRITLMKLYMKFSGMITRTKNNVNVPNHF